MRRLLALGLFTALMTGCSSSTTEQRYVTETEIELISRARDAMTANGYPLKDRIYQVRRDNDGWTVEVDKSGGCSRTGEPLFVVDATIFVTFNSAGVVTKILTRSPTTRPTTIPAAGVPVSSAILVE